MRETDLLREVGNHNLHNPSAPTKFRVAERGNGSAIERRNDTKSVSETRSFGARSRRGHPDQMPPALVKASEQFPLCKADFFPVISQISRNRFVKKLYSYSNILEIYDFRPTCTSCHPSPTFCRTAVP